MRLSALIGLALSLVSVAALAKDASPASEPPSAEVMRWAPSGGSTSKDWRPGDGKG